MGSPVTLWNSQVFLPPYSGSKIATSQTINNNAEAVGVKAVIEYETLLPDGDNTATGWTLIAIIEEEIAPGIWIPAAVQQKQVKGSAGPKQQIIILSPGLVENPGVEESVFQGNVEIASISRTEGPAPETIRVCVVINEFNNGLPTEPDSVTISGYVRLFDK